MSGERGRGRTFAPSGRAAPDLVQVLQDPRASFGLPAKGTFALVPWCSDYGGVTACCILVAHGPALVSLGADLGLEAAAFHGHWRFC